MTQRLDHVVLPVADLDVARARLSALGFTVAPDGVHPFGTANCCVFFADGAYLEPLAIWDASIAADAIRAGNVFVARDHVFRAVVGDEGLSAVVLTTPDADADHARFSAQGIAIGDVLNFSREFSDPSGRKDIASFKLAFAGDADIADAFAFTCERVNTPDVDRSALQRHDNGVTGIAGLVLVDGAQNFASLLERLGADEQLVDVRFAQGKEASRTVLALVLYADLPALQLALEANAIPFSRHDTNITVPPAPGQGVHFIFEASP
ncbi:MAG: VOC family protein [Mesorhizobium sp.]